MILSDKLVRTLVVFFLFLELAASENPFCSNNGDVDTDGACVCNQGFSGLFCESCTGRIIKTDQKGTIVNGPRVSSDYTTGAPANHESNCMFIISPDIGANETLMVEFVEAPGNCENDKLQVFDGDVLDSPLLAQFNGATSTEVGVSLKGRKLSQSGSLLFDFYSEGLQFTESGYTINYWVQKDCNSSCQGILDGTGGPNTQLWSGDVKLLKWNEMTLQSRASMASCTIDSRRTVVLGGEAYARDQTTFANFISFDNVDLTWNRVNASNEIPVRSFHSLVYWERENMLLTYGGQLSDGNVTDELWRYSLGQWRRMTLVESNRLPALMGHTAHYVEVGGVPCMMVFFGFSPKWQFSDFVYSLSLDRFSWNRVDTAGYRPQGRFGHASVYDVSSGLVYVSGGFRYESLNELLSFDVAESQWKILPASPSYTFLHTVSLLSSGELLVIGGKMCNDAESCTCDRSENFKYNIDLEYWDRVDNNELTSTTQRYGHVSLTGDEKSDRALFFGGMAGVMLDDVIEYTPPSGELQCAGLNETDCEAASDCFYDGDVCRHNNSPHCEALCAAIESCERCRASFCNCCFDEISFSCSFNSTSPTCNYTLSSCERTDEEFCRFYSECDSCFEAGCYWDSYYPLCKPTDNTTDTSTADDVCSLTCDEARDCESCVRVGGCEWCESSGSCARSDLVAGVADPYYQCTTGFLSQCPVANATNIRCQTKTSCSSCLEDKRCGWCVGNSTTGVGSCYEGSVEGSDYCRADDWKYFECPDCQCNGHSTCSPLTPDQCGECDLGYTGSQCQSCDQLYYGSALNGKQCKACECNNHADNCTAFGTCECKVFGMTGKNCDECNMADTFFGDAVNDTCFYPMNVNQQYIFQRSVMPVPQLGFDICLRKLDALSFAVEVVNKRPAFLVVEINSTSPLDNVTYGSFQVNMSTSFVLSSDLLTKTHGNACVRLMFDFLTGATYVSVSVTQNDYLILKVILSLSMGAIFLLLVGLGAYKFRQYSDLRNFLEFEIAEGERRAKRPMTFVNICIDQCSDKKSIKQEEEDREGDDEKIAVLGQEVLKSNKRSFCTVFLLLPEQKNEKSEAKGIRHLALGSGFVQYDSDTMRPPGTSDTQLYEDQATQVDSNASLPAAPASSTSRFLARVFSRTSVTGSSTPAPPPDSRDRQRQLEMEEDEEERYGFENPVVRLDDERPRPTSNRQTRVFEDVVHDDDLML